MEMGQIIALKNCHGLKRYVRLKDGSLLDPREWLQLEEQREAPASMERTADSIVGNAAG